MLEVKNVYYRIGGTEILRGISAKFEAGIFNAIIGPNGSGKSTLLKIANGELTPSTGEVYYGDRKITKERIQEIAQIRAVLAQHSELNFPLSIEEIVSMGRYPHFINIPSKNDYLVVAEVLRSLHLSSMKTRNYLTLSGGEKQRVHFARVLAQLWHKSNTDPHYLLLDEPISYLDLNYQHEFLKRSKQLAKNGDVVVAVLHDISLAAQYADRIFVLNQGSLISHGKPSEVVTSELIEMLYKVQSKVMPVEDDVLRIIVHAK